MSLLIRNFTKEKINSRHLELVTKTVLKEEKFYAGTEISLVFTGEKRMRDLNFKYRGKDRVTDVLSFEERASCKDKFVDPENDTIYLGEIFICVKRARWQAREQKHSLKEETDALLVHGLLHLLGYDHIKEKDYRKMSGRENVILSALKNREKLCRN